MVRNMGFEDIVLSAKSFGRSDELSGTSADRGQDRLPSSYRRHRVGNAVWGMSNLRRTGGSLLLAGIGDTIRVSLTADPVKEIPVAREILKSTGYFPGGIDFVSCPTCSRCKTDLTRIADEIMAQLGGIEKGHAGKNCRV